MDIKIIHTPGHSPGGICILVGNALFSGDTLFADSIGRTDFPGGSLELLTKSIHEKLFTLDGGIQVFPGHMQATTLGYEREYNPFVRLKRKKKEEKTEQFKM
ncbi:MAG: MBL fold metallo-hydrolase, partial [Anaerovoracaceae bacterium]